MATKSFPTDNCHLMSLYNAVPVPLHSVSPKSIKMVTPRRLLALLCLLAGLNMAVSETSDFCLPGMSCYPKIGAFAELANILDGGLTGSILDPQSPTYANMSIMKDTLHTHFPAYIVLARSVEDVQKTMLFARKYNLRVTIQSSGHDYLGRSTADGSVMINLSNMKGIDIDLNSPLNADGVIRSESGNSWARVYEEVNKHNRIVIGGSAHTVAMGGYTLGGGHSPMSRSLGLAVDNLLEVTMVTADGSIVNASASGIVRVAPDGKITRSDNSDLFWALRGGGGGTFGVVTTFVFKLHKPPSSFGHLTCVFAYSMIRDQTVASDLIKFYFDLAKTLPNEWGGYFIGSFDYSDPSFALSVFTVSMLHYGPSSLPSFAKIQPLIDYHPERQVVKCVKQDYATFWDYEKTTNDPLYIRVSLVSSFVRPSDFNEDMADFIRDIVMVPPTNRSLGGCTNTLIGGKVSTVGRDDTAVTPNFRTALGSLSCGLAWEDNPFYDKENVAAGTKLEQRLQKLSHGVYLNEPPPVMNNWKRDFWGDHYARLLKVKKTWDPSNFLTCLYCVGSDLGRNYANHAGTPIIG